MAYGAAKGPCSFPAGNRDSRRLTRCHLMHVLRQNKEIYIKPGTGENISKQRDMPRTRHKSSLSLCKDKFWTRTRSSVTTQRSKVPVHITTCPNILFPTMAGLFLTHFQVVSCLMLFFCLLSIFLENYSSPILSICSSSRDDVNLVSRVACDPGLVNDL